MRRYLFLLLVVFSFGTQVLEAKKKPLGNGVFWEVTKQGELIISGNGAIPDYKKGKYGEKGTAPWNKKICIKR